MKKPISSSLLSSLKLNLPTSGSVNGAVMTSLPRGKCATVPPSKSCSRVTKRSLCCMAARLAEKPAGPQPTMTTSSICLSPVLAALRIEFDRLPSLFDGIANQAHAAQFAGDEDAGHVCLEVFVDVGDVDTACLGAEYECDGVDGANCLARAVADAMRRFNQRCLAANQSDDVAFGAGPYAGAAADAFRGIDDRMQRGRFEQTGLSRRGELRGTVRLAPLPRDHVGSPYADHWGGVDNEQIESHASLYRLLTVADWPRGAGNPWLACVESLRMLLKRLCAEIPECSLAVPTDEALDE